MITYSYNDGPVYWPKEDSHDPDSEVIYFLDYFLPTRQDGKAYTKGRDIVVPVVPNGCMYECVSGGISAIVTPLLPTLENKKVVDGDVTWKCLPLLTQMSYGDAIVTSSWSGDVGVVITSESIINSIATSVKITGVPVDTTSFTVTNTINILYLNGDTEKRQKSIIIPIKEL